MPLISVPEAIKSLQEGELVAIPTETVYGLAGRIDREETLRSIFLTKSRPFFDPLIVHVADSEQARDLAKEWPAIYDLLAREFWPGPLTLIAPKTERISSLITSGLDSVGLRCPKHPLALEILRGVGVPLAAPSANRFGRTSPTRAEHVIAEFADQVKVVDGGPCEVGVESTVLRAELRNQVWNVEILRPGGISQPQIRHLLEREKVSFTITRAHSIASPGHTKAHYQPESPVVILNGKISDEEVIKLRLREHGHVVNQIRHLKLPEDVTLAARVLYQNFRELSAEQTAIVVEKHLIHAGEDWQAVWDRIERAAILHL